MNSNGPPLSQKRDAPNKPLVNKSWWLSQPKSWRKCPFQLTEINSEITRRGEFKSDLIVLGGVLNDALGWVDLRCVVRLPRTPVLLPCLRQFSGRSRGSIRTPGANARRFPVADHCHSSPLINLFLRMTTDALRGNAHEQWFMNFGKWALTPHSNWCVKENEV